MRRRVLILVPGLALALLVLGGLWPASGGSDSSSDGRVPTVLSPFQAHPAAGFFISVPFSLADPATVSADGRQVVYRGDTVCREGAQLRIVMSAVQAESRAFGWGHTGDVCTGELQRFEVPINTLGLRGYETGADARFFGWAATFEGGRQLDSHTWWTTATLHPED